MIKNYLMGLVLAAGLFTSGGAQAQRNCGTMQHLEQQQMLDPGLEQRMQMIEEQTQNWILANQNNTNRSQAVITIPVVVHVVYNTASQNISDAQVQSQIEVLNEDFRKLNADVANTPSVFAGLTADCQINFCLAQRDPNGNATNGIIHKQTSVTSFSSNDNVKRSANGGDDAWNSSQYLNLWACNLGGGLLGYAQFPGGAASTDGVVILYSAFGRIGNVGAPYDKGRTATHEVGHWLNLRHIWGDANCGSDLVNDTPTQQTSNFGCPSFPHVTCSNGPNGDMFMNYMDYTDDACMYMFTAGQSSRMSAAINASRPGIITSQGCVPPAGGTCNVPAGLAASSITTTTATISWGAVSGASSYNVNYRVVGAASWISSSQAATSKALSGLTASTNYEFQVQTVCASGNSAFSSTATFTTSAVTTGCTDPYEPNASRTAAKPVAMNTDLFAKISSTTDNDYYTFTTTASAAKIKLVLDQLPADYDMRLISSTGATLKTSQNGGTSAETIIRNVTTAATYYIRVWGFSGANSTNCYRLRVNTSNSNFRNGSFEENEITPVKVTGLDNVSVYPNPTDGNLTVTYFNTENNTITMDVIDLLGKTVLSQHVASEDGFQKSDLNTSSLTNGIYMLRMKQNDQTVVKKFVVKH